MGQDFAYTGNDNLEVMAEARNYNAFLVREVVEAVAPVPHPRVLDFGAGTGTYAALLRDSGVSADCLEPDRAQQEQIRDRGFTVVPDLDAIPDESYDLAYSLNVLEHIEDDLAAVTALREKIRPGGRLVVYVPAFMVLFSSMDTKVGHFRRYRKQALVTLIEESGFDVVHARYCDPLGFFAALLFRFIGDDSGAINPRMIRLFDRIIFPISRRLEQITGGVFGKNVLVLAQRPVR